MALPPVYEQEGANKEREVTPEILDEAEQPTQSDVFVNTDRNRNVKQLGEEETPTQTAESRQQEFE